MDIRIPVKDLGQLATLSIGSTVRVDDTTERISLQICTVGIELSASVVGGETNAVVIEEADDLDVAWGLHPLKKF
jgi:hypothetical protein